MKVVGFYGSGDLYQYHLNERLIMYTVSKLRGQLDCFGVRPSVCAKFITSRPGHTRLVQDEGGLAMQETSVFSFRNATSYTRFLLLQQLRRYDS